MNWASIVQCPYHALEFNCEGKCVKNPNGTQVVPRKSDLRVYPALEKHELIWVWMGDPEQALGLSSAYATGRRCYPRGEVTKRRCFIYGTDILTPTSKDKTRYFWAITGLSNDPAAFGSAWTAGIQHAFGEQDKPMIESQQRLLKQQGVIDIEELQHAAIPTDAGPARARKVLNKLRDAHRESGVGTVADPQNSDLLELYQKSLQETDTVKPVV